jgi:insulysin
MWPLVTGISYEVRNLFNDYALNAYQILGYNDAELVLSITKDDILKMFRTHVDPRSPARAKLSVHMVAQKLGDKRASLDALKACEEKLRSFGLDLNQLDWRKTLQDELPTLDEFFHFWNDALEGRDDRDQLLEEMAQAVAKCSTEKVADEVNPNATYIEDVPAFKRGLGVSIDPSPIVEWGDLPTSKF